MLSALLEAQVLAQELAPDDIDDLELITVEELEEIRRIWVSEKHEIEDSLPALYERAVGRTYPGANLQITNAVDNDALAILKELCAEHGDEDGVKYQMLRELLHVEQEYRTMARRAGLYPALDRAIEKAAFDNESDAEEFGMRRKRELDGIAQSRSVQHTSQSKPQ
jgi:DNA sulfur modification protein DndC